MLKEKFKKKKELEARLGMCDIVKVYIVLVISETERE